jgi:hypothetical protein
MVFWLILVLGSGEPLHVGNFTNSAACEAAAKKAVIMNPTAGAASPYVGFICVQSNETTTRPPGG